MNKGAKDEMLNSDGMDPGQLQETRQFHLQEPGGLSKSIKIFNIFTRAKELFHLDLAEAMLGHQVGAGHVRAVKVSGPTD